MALPKKGTRKIEVDGVVYGWYIRRKPTYCEGAFETSMHVAIERYGSPRTLYVNLRVSRPDNWLAPHQTALKPAMVRAIIQEALSNDWEPSKPGPPFQWEHALIKDQP